MNLVVLGSRKDWNILQEQATYRNPLAKIMVAYCYANENILVVSNNPSLAQVDIDTLSWVRQETEDPGCKYCQYY
jgi:hypothetical protein